MLSQKNIRATTPMGATLIDGGGATFRVWGGRAKAVYLNGVFGGVTRTGMVPDEHAPGLRNLLEPEIMGPAIAWLASAEAFGVTDERIVAAEFDQWLSDRRKP